MTNGHLSSLPDPQVRSGQHRRQRLVPGSRSTRWLVVFILAILLPVSGCNPIKARRLAAEAAVQFHQQLFESKDDVIYDAAAPDFQKAVSRESFKHLLSVIRRKMGGFGRVEGTNIGFYVQPIGTVVTMQVQANCANGPLGETFIWLIKNDRAVLLKYGAESPLLLGE